MVAALLSYPLGDRVPWEPGSQQAPIAFDNHGGPEACIEWVPDSDVWDCYLIERARRAIRRADW